MIFLIIYSFDDLCAFFLWNYVFICITICWRHIDMNRLAGILILLISGNSFRVHGLWELMLCFEQRKTHQRTHKIHQCFFVKNHIYHMPFHVLVCIYTMQKTPHFRELIEAFLRIFVPWSFRHNHTPYCDGWEILHQLVGVSIIPIHHQVLLDLSHQGNAILIWENLAS